MMFRSNQFQCSNLLLSEPDQPDLALESSSSSSSSSLDCELEFNVHRSSLKRAVSTEEVDLSPLPKRRRVQFDDSRTSFHGEGRIMSSEDQESTFYTRQDLNNMKQAAKKFCAHFDLDDPLFRAYQHHGEAPVDDEIARQKASVLSSSQGFEEQRGLERWTSQTHLLSRCVNIVRVRTEVLLEQTSQSITLQKDPEKLAQVYRAASAPSASYARVLGLADVALRDNNSQSPATSSS